VNSVRQTISFAKKLDLDYAEFSILTPYPGTPIYEYAEKKGLLLTKDWSKYTALEPVMKIKNITAKQLKSLLQKAYINFYLTPKMIWKWIKNRQLQYILNAFKAAINYLRESVA